MTYASLPKTTESFAPFWLSMTIFDCPEGTKLVESFVDKIPRHVHGRLILINQSTNEEYTRAADRYATTTTFLASLWMFKNTQFSMLSEGARIRVDTGILTMVQQPFTPFIHALTLGEDAYKKEKVAKTSRLSENHQANQSSGHWVWIEDEDS